MKPIEATGQKFGKLLMISRTNIQSKSRSYKWLARCDCGNEVVVVLADCRYGTTQSCGCLRKEISTARRLKTVGYEIKTLRDSGAYKSWLRMRGRCFGKNNLDRHNYSERGITVCGRWNEFALFFEDMGERPLGMTIDRINNDGNYEPGNCRWATSKQQARNRRNNTLVSINGQTHVLAEWAELLGINPQTVHDRMHRGWSAVRSLTQTMQSGV